jgi:uncharacterized protein
MRIAEPQIEMIREICRSTRVKSLFAFGSVTREDFGDSSDIDMVVDFEEQDPFLYTDLYFTLKSSLESILNRQIDLLEERAIRNHIFREQLDRTKVMIYAS